MYPDLEVAEKRTKRVGNETRKKRGEKHKGKSNEISGKVATTLRSDLAGVTVARKQVARRLLVICVISESYLQISKSMRFGWIFLIKYCNANGFAILSVIYLELWKSENDMKVRRVMQGALILFASFFMKICNWLKKISHRTSLDSFYLPASSSSLSAPRRQEWKLRDSLRPPGDVPSIDIDWFISVFF